MSAPPPAARHSPLRGVDTLYSLFPPLCIAVPDLLDALICYGKPQFCIINALISDTDRFSSQLIFSVFKTLTDQTVTVELKNELMITGVLKSVDQCARFSYEDA